MMSNWKHNFAAILMDLLRLTIRICLFIDGIVLALLSVYITVRFAIHAAGWISRTFFSSPW